MKKTFLLLAAMLFMNQAKAQTVDTQACDALYANRGSDSLKAYDCYLPLLSDQNDPDAQKKFYQKMFVALSAVINDLPKSDSEITAIQKGLELVDRYQNQFDNTSSYYYWKACFLSFDAIQKDRGGLIPTHMFKVLGSLQDLLQKSIKLDPSVHFYGPMRVLGMMHTQMPKIVGGDKILAEKMLQEAYVQAPGFSMNQLAYAKILDINGKTEEAIKVLKAFIATDINYFDPIPEAIKDKMEGQKLLSDLEE